MKEEQGGFRKGYSTTDRVFILSGLIEKHESGKNKLYVPFLDLKKAFDNVNRVLLKKSLHDVGLPSCFICFVVKMYFETMQQ